MEFEGFKEGDKVLIPMTLTYTGKLYPSCRVSYGASFIDIPKEEFVKVARKENENESETKTVEWGTGVIKTDIAEAKNYQDKALLFEAISEVLNSLLEVKRALGITRYDPEKGDSDKWTLDLKDQCGEKVHHYNRKFSDLAHVPF